MGEDDYSWLMNVYPDPDAHGGGAAAFGVGGGDNTNAGVDFNAGGASATPGGGGVNLDFGRLLKAAGFNTSTGGLDILSILGLLAPLLTGFTTSDAARKASNQMSDAAKQANAQIGGYITDANARYAPYVTGGQNAFTKAAANPFTPLAPQFRPLGSGAALNSIYNAGRK
jgi:hypothetical protein